MKAVILVAGEGTRLKPITSTRPKPLIPVGGIPLLEYNIKGLKKAGIDDILLIVGYKKEQIINYFGTGNDLGVNITYKIQDEYLGTAHATGYAKEFVGEDSFLLMYGDLIVDLTIFEEVIDTYRENKYEGLISLLEVSNPQSYGIITLNSDGIVEKITEKPPPEMNLGNLANAGIYIFSPLIFKAIDKTKLSKRQEYEFTDSMEILINEFKGKIYGFLLGDKMWNDIGLPWQLFEANRYILDNQKEKIEGKLEENVVIQGNVSIGKGTMIKAGSYIQGPCFIGENNKIGPNAFIRPYTSIQNNCHVGISEIKNSIILSNTNIPHFNYIGDSIICEDVNLGAGTKVANLRLDEKNICINVKGKRMDSQRRKFGTIIGPDVKTGINVSILCGKILNEHSRIGAHTVVNEDVPSNYLYYFDSNTGIIKKEKKSE